MACSGLCQVDLKDKWRNLMRVAVLPAATLRIKSAKRHELPLDLLVKVTHAECFSHPTICAALANASLALPCCPLPA